MPTITSSSRSALDHNVSKDISTGCTYAFILADGVVVGLWDGLGGRLFWAMDFERLEWNQMQAVASRHRTDTRRTLRTNYNVLRPPSVYHALI